MVHCRVATGQFAASSSCGKGPAACPTRAAGWHQPALHRHYVLDVLRRGVPFVICAHAPQTDHDLGPCLPTSATSRAGCDHIWLVITKSRSERHPTNWVRMPVTPRSASNCRCDGAACFLSSSSDTRASSVGRNMNVQSRAVAVAREDRVSLALTRRVPRRWTPGALLAPLFNGRLTRQVAVRM